MDDGEAVRRMRGGDISGLESLVCRYQGRAVRAAFLITLDEPTAEDVVQDVFVRLFRRIRSFDQTRPLEPYLMRSVVNGALNAVRRERRASSLDADPEPLENLLRTPTVEQEAERAERGREILRALGKLSARQRTAIVQRYYFEWSEQEMAQALQAPPGTVKWLLHAARLRLRALLGSERGAE
jgi:RNA polymerase sigma-70 factor (ECF subfamily)